MTVVEPLTVPALAVTVMLPAVAGAVNSPPVEIVAPERPLTDQVTGVE